MIYEICEARTAEEKERLSQELLANLRQIDREEMEGLGITSEHGVRCSIFNTNPVYYGRNLNNGKLAVCWGLQIYPGKEKTTYLIWALGTDEIKKVRKTFIKESAKILRKWADRYGELTNRVGTFNRDSVAWLKWLGADFGKPQLINGKEYVDFYLRKREE